MKKRPTRIVQKPQTNGFTTEILCDDGKIYSITSLAALLGMEQSALSQRIRRLGWDHPDLFVKKSHRGEEIMQQSPYKVWQEGDLAHLSSNPRWKEQKKTS